jgi:RNase H-fold protein (predicted Holliday junction resolvase)
VTVLGVDPGTRKCGYALVNGRDVAPVVLGIVALEGLTEMLATLAREHRIDVVALGQGTNSAHVAEILGTLALPYTLVDERETTLRARARFFADHPPRGWKWFVPRGMLMPDRPIDDYAALLIAQRYLADR